MATTIEYHEDCIQSLYPTWWISDESGSVGRGSLIWAVIPHVSADLWTLKAVGRAEDTVHTSAEFKLAPISVRQQAGDRRLPVAALPDYPDEDRLVFRAKRRPAIVLSGRFALVDGALRAKATKWQTAPTILVAPLYTADSSGKGGGWNGEFVQRIRRNKYRQYMWERSPLDGRESVIRLDHIQPVGDHATSIVATGFRLCDDALEVLQERIDWVFRGELPEGGAIRAHHEIVADIEAAN